MNLRFLAKSCFLLICGLSEKKETITFPRTVHGGIAQRLEQPAHNWLVPGSNPGTPTWGIVNEQNAKEKKKHLS